MSDLLGRIDGGVLIALTAIVGGVLYGIVASVMDEWRRLKTNEIDASLKQQMLDKGMGADEIERVLRASSRSGRKTPKAE